MMTRQDYVEVARIIRDCTFDNAAAEAPHPMEYVDRAQLIAALADYFKRDNARFDRGRFLAACEAK